MNELAAINNYSQFKEALGTELRNQAEGFVRTGYLLKVARDTDILKDSGYATVAEFAHAEYGLSKDIVSRYIAINDRYSKDGYSEYLQEQYEGYGVAKLQEMLTLPDEVIGLMTPEMSKREIQDIKKEIREEEQISDLEVYLEGSAPDEEHMTVLQKAIRRYFYEHREQYLNLQDVIKGACTFDEAVEKILNELAPSGIALHTARVQGVGKLIISVRGKENDIEMLNVRSNEKQVITWQQFIDSISSAFGGCAGIEAWEMVYQESFSQEQPPEKEKSKVAPVQQVKAHDKPKEVPIAEHKKEAHEENTVAHVADNVAADVEYRVVEDAKEETAAENETPAEVDTPAEEERPAATCTPEEKKIDKLYELLKADIDNETEAALKWAIFELESIYCREE